MTEYTEGVWYGVSPTCIPSTAFIIEVKSLSYLEPLCVHYVSDINEIREEEMTSYKNDHKIGPSTLVAW